MSALSAGAKNVSDIFHHLFKKCKTTLLNIISPFTNSAGSVINSIGSYDIHINEKHEPIS